jgi:hypothetical protein
MRRGYDLLASEALVYCKGYIRLRYHMRFSVLLIFSLFVPVAAASDAIGVFTSIDGEVQILRGLNMLAAAQGVEVKSDDVVETGKGASAQLDMEDGSVLKLGPQTRIELTDYQLDADKGVVSATVDVLSGWMRFAVAKLKPTGRYNLSTPMLNIGVRGTEGTIQAENDEGGLHLEEGAVDVQPLGSDVTSFASLRINSGEFVQRLRGKPLAKLPGPPAAFKKRLPKEVQEKLLRRAQKLKERGVPPRLIRRITRQDAKQYLERHPHKQEKLRDRFKSLGDDDSSSKGKDTDKTPDAAGGFGSKVLRERALKAGQPRDSQEVSEALRRRYDAQQKGAGNGPRIGDTLPGRQPLSIPPAEDAQAPKVMPQFNLPLNKPATESIKPDAPATGVAPKVLVPIAPAVTDAVKQEDAAEQDAPIEKPELLRPPTLLPQRQLQLKQ